MPQKPNFQRFVCMNGYRDLISIIKMTVNVMTTLDSQEYPTFPLQYFSEIFARS